ncbi:hypothetical protein D3C85_1049930 [compost metagenome]
MADPAPLCPQAGGDQAAVGLSVRQVDALALKHGLRQGLGHFLRVGRIAHLLQLQTHTRDPSQEHLQTQPIVIGLALGIFAQQGQQRTEGGIQRTAWCQGLLVDHRHFVLVDQLLCGLD